MIQRFISAALKEAQAFSVPGSAQWNANKAQPGELVLLAELVSNKSEYTINIGSENGETSIPIERRLAFRDNFLVAGMAIGVLPVFLDSGTPYWGADAPEYWEDPTVFDAAATGVLTESQAIAGVWNGTMKFQTNEGLKINEMNLQSFRTVQQTQDSATTANMQTGLEYKSLGGIIKLAGGNKNQISINIQSLDKAVIAGDATHKNYLYIKMIGAYIRGGTIAELQG